MTDSVLIDSLDTFEIRPSDRCEGMMTDADRLAAVTEERDLLRRQLHEARNELMRIPLLEMELAEKAANPLIVYDPSIHNQRQTTAKPGAFAAEIDHAAMHRMMQGAPSLAQHRMMQGAPSLAQQAAAAQNMRQSSTYGIPQWCPRLAMAPQTDAWSIYRRLALAWRWWWRDEDESADRRRFWREFIAGRDHLTDAEIDEAIAAAQEAVVIVRAEDG